MRSASPCNYDLTLAWKRLKGDRRDRCFITHPYLIELIEQDLDGWLSSVAEILSQDYRPSPAAVCHEPKPGWLLRPGTHLRIKDELVYTALAGRLYPKIEGALRWSQGRPDTSYLLNQEPAGVEWVRSGFRAWNDFRQKSLEAARKTEFVVVIDIAAFYENVDIGRLVSDVRHIGASKEEIDLLATCLNRWAEPRGKGIPQGYTASDILAKLYLNPLDQAIKNEGFDHLRYVDDIRVFCTDLQEAKSALRLVIERLRLRGLNVQSAKTEILRVDKAITEIDGVTPVIRSIASELADELRMYAAEAGYTVSLRELAQIVSQNEESPSADLLETAFRSYFPEASAEAFDRTLFHYLLTRLGILRSREAVSYCFDLLPRRPEETRFILKYLGDVGPAPHEIEAVLRFTCSREAFYDFQIYEILKFIHDQGIEHPLLLPLARELIQDRNRPLWLRSYALALVGENGVTSDLEHIESLYSTAENDIERADIICALRRYELVRRNAFLGRAARDGEIEARSVRWVKRRNGMKQRETSR